MWMSPCVCRSDVAGNPLSCACTARWLQRVLRHRPHAAPRFLAGNDVTCFDDVTGRARNVSDVDFSQCGKQQRRTVYSTDSEQA